MDIRRKFRCQLLSNHPVGSIVCKCSLHLALESCQSGPYPACHTSCRSSQIPPQHHIAHQHWSVHCVESFHALCPIAKGNLGRRVDRNARAEKVRRKQTREAVRVRVRNIRPPMYHRCTQFHCESVCGMPELSSVHKPQMHLTAA